MNIRKFRSRVPGLRVFARLRIFASDKKMDMLKTLLIVGGGSFLGGIARYLVKIGCEKGFRITAWPLGTFLVNIVGCFLIGLFYGWAARHTGLSRDLLLFLTFGLCGGFTTFSTFIHENFSLLQAGAALTMLGYMALSVLSGFICLWFGTLLAR